MIWKSQMSNSSAVEHPQVKRTYPSTHPLTTSWNVGEINGIKHPKQGPEGHPIKGQAYGILQHHNSLDRGSQNHQAGSSPGKRVERIHQRHRSFNPSGTVGPDRALSLQDKALGATIPRQWKPRGSNHRTPEPHETLGVGRKPRRTSGRGPQKLNDFQLRHLYIPPYCRQDIFSPTLQSTAKACLCAALWQASWDPGDGADRANNPSDGAAMGNFLSDGAAESPETITPRGAPLQGTEC